MLDEDIGLLVGQHVPQHAAAYAGDDAHEHQQKQVIVLGLLKGALNAHHREQPQTDGVQPQHHQLIGPALHRQQVPHRRQEHQGRHPHGHQGIHRLAEHHRRGDAQGQVPDDPAAAGGAHAQDHHAEGVQLALKPRQGPGGGKNRRSHDFQYEKYRIGHKNRPFSSECPGIIAQAAGPRNGTVQQIFPVVARIYATI